MEFKKRQSQRFSKGELKDTEDIICLNNWNPIKSKKLPVDTVTDSKPKENIQGSYNKLFFMFVKI